MFDPRAALRDVLLELADNPVCDRLLDRLADKVVERLFARLIEGTDRLIDDIRKLGDR